MIIYHHNDTDGRSSAAIVGFTHSTEKCVMVEVDYVKPFPLQIIKPGEEVFIVDYSFTNKTKDTLTKILEISNGNVTWIDHHQSSITFINTNEGKELLQKCKDTCISNEGSGAYLCWKKFIPCTEVSYPVKLISDHDTWSKKYSDSDIYELGLQAMHISPYNYDEWKKILVDKENMYDIMNKGIIIQGCLDSDYEDYRNSYSFEAVLKGLNVKVINRFAPSAIHGFDIYNYDAVVVFCFNGEKYKYSIFTDKDDVRCDKIAESFGGGGHQKAAGFESLHNIFENNK